MKFNKRQIGRKIRIIKPEGSKFRDSNWPENIWCENGTIATIIVFRPKILGTGIVLDEDEEGNLIRDTGFDAWHIVEIVPGATTTIDEDGYKKDWEWAD